MLIAGQTYTLLAARPHKTNILFTLKEISDLSAAEKLNGQEVFITERPAADIIFYEDILGKTVLDRGQNIGTVTDILQTPAHDVLVIKPDTERALSGVEGRSRSVREILVPQIDKFILEISDTIKVDLSELQE